MSELINHGINVCFCDAVTAIDFDIVLVSITSSYDLIALLSEVRGLEWWQPQARRFKVFAGGAGLTNPVAIRQYVDYAVFGRCDDWIANAVDAVLCGGSPSHESIMHLPDIHRVVVAQAKKLYYRKIGDWGEDFIGCQHSCMFCLYRWSRKFIGSRKSYINTSLCDGSSPEMMYKDLCSLPRKVGRIRCAIDGFSERLRFAYGKHITNDMIIDGIEHVGDFAGVSTMLVYNIANMPAEDESDRQEMYDVLARSNPKNRVIFILHSTPFRPSNLTPMQWHSVNTKSLKDLRAKEIVSMPNLLAKHSFSLEGPWSHILCLLMERCKPQYDQAVMWAVSARGRNQEKSVIDFQARFKDVYLDLVREYTPFVGDHPADIIDSYTPRETIKEKANQSLNWTAKNRRQLA